MATPFQESCSNLEKLEEERRRQIQLIEHVRSLLERADERRKIEPENYRKWNRVLDNLESALSEAKAKLQSCEAYIRKAQEWQRTSAAGLSPEEAEADKCLTADELDVFAKEDGELTQEVEAVQAILTAPLDSVEQAPLEQVALVKRFLDDKPQSRMAESVVRRLAGRVELAIQGRNLNAPKPMVTRTAEERRHQKALRELVAKLQRNRLNTLSVHDLEFAAECYSLLAQRIDLDDSELRLKDILLHGLREADRLFAQIRRRARLTD